MTTTITIQPGQPGNGLDYDVHRSVPYPFHIDAGTGACTRGRGTSDLGEAPEGSPWRLIGFQSGDIQELVLGFADFTQDPSRAVGLVPVFTDAEVGIFALREPVTDVTDHRTSAKSTIRPVQTWKHSRKGLIRGVVVGDRGEFLDIELVEDHAITVLSAGDDGYRAAGEVISVRASLLTGVTA